MKISYHRRRKIKTRRIAIRELMSQGIENPIDLAKELKVTVPTIKKDLEAMKTMSEEDFTFATKQTSQEILDKKDIILKMLDDENYYTKNGNVDILKITEELNTSRATVLSVLNGEQESKIKIINVISNENRLNLIRSFCEDDLENQLENVLKNILENGSTSLKSMIKLFDLMDNSQDNDSQISYSIGNRTIEVINTCQQLEVAMSSIELIPFIGFDSEQKPIFKRGQADNGICLIQLATKEKCYLIQIKQIKNLKPLINLLEDEKIVKIGTGLKGDNLALFKQFNLKVKSMIDLEDIFKKLSSKNQIGAKKAASIILNEKLQKSKNMSRSNWENKELTIGQIKYASEDATVVYDVMSKIIEEYPFVMKMMPPFFQEKYS